MIDRIMNECNNHFANSIEYATAIVSDGITGTFAETYIAGQYVYLVGSRVNDGVYLVASATASKITISGATLTAEATSDLKAVIGCATPKAFLDLVTEISTWQTSNANKDGITSESISRYSVSYKNGGGWSEVFRSKLDAWRCIYDPADRMIRKAQSECKGW